MPEFADPDHLHALAFRQAVRIGQFNSKQIAETLRLPCAKVDAIRKGLLHLRLLQPSAHDSEVFVPVSPEAAATELVRMSEDEIRNLQEDIDRTKRRLNKLLPAYVEGRSLREQVEQSLEPLQAADHIRWMLKEQAERCRSEILISRRGDLLPAADSVGAMHPELLEAARRGTRIRAVYQHAALGDQTTRGHIEELAAAGALVRIRAEPAGQLIIFGAQVAIVFGREPSPGSVDAGYATEAGYVSEAPTAVAVRDATVIGHLRATFDQTWDDVGSSAPEDMGDARTLGLLQLSIIRLLAQGFKDDVVARRLGISVRTCRRHIKEIMNELDASSRFQAGVRATLNGSVTETDHNALM
ncbi:helix-turn-helix transcriptional regulator [Streptomyces sp. NBC_00370]|uniref:helix-turn-helix transcriptional regulator n=1 Tax=Streptomyces sp. NBC_00370 TaxID=2975728 RepID=UPI002E273E24